MREIKVGNIYKHFKGHIYRVISIGYDSENYDEDNKEKSKLVVYENILTKEVWVRPYDMFNSLVDKEKYPDIKQEYRFEETNEKYIDNIKIGIGVLILKDNKVLLGHRCGIKDTGGIFEPDSWTLPGGKQEINETIFECAKRETKEEANLNISNLEVFGAGDDIQPGKHYVTLYIKALEYSGELKVMEPDKLDKWEWFDLNNLPENLYSPSRKTLELYLKKEGIIC